MATLKELERRFEQIEADRGMTIEQKIAELLRIYNDNVLAALGGSRDHGRKSLVVFGLGDAIYRSLREVYKITEFDGRVSEEGAVKVAGVEVPLIKVDLTPELLLTEFPKCSAKVLGTVRNFLMEMASRGKGTYKEGPITLRDVMIYSREEWLTAKGIGGVTFGKIEAFLFQSGVAFGTQVPEGM